MFLWGIWCEGSFYAQITLWAAWGNLRDSGANLILTEGVYHTPKEILSLGLLPVEIKVQGGDEEKGGN